MTSLKTIKNYGKELDRRFHPDRVVLFGSYARGDSNDDSDVDILVVMNHEKSRNVEQAIASNTPAI